MTERVAAAIAEMEANRDIHAAWRDHFARCPVPGLCPECKSAAGAAGDVATHEGHIAKYNGWIALLRDLG